MSPAKAQPFVDDGRAITKGYAGEIPAAVGILDACLYVDDTQDGNESVRYDIARPYLTALIESARAVALSTGTGVILSLATPLSLVWHDRNSRGFDFGDSLPTPDQNLKHLTSNEKVMGEI